MLMSVEFELMYNLQCIMYNYDTVDPSVTAVTAPELWNQGGLTTISMIHFNNKNVETFFTLIIHYTLYIVNYTLYIKLSFRLLE